jgi:hypothetical protein
MNALALAEAVPLTRLSLLPQRKPTSPDGRGEIPSPGGRGWREAPGEGRPIRQSKYRKTKSGRGGY